MKPLRVLAAALAPALAFALLAGCGAGALDEYGTPRDPGASMASASSGPFVLSSAGVANGALSPAYGMRIDVHTRAYVSVSPPLEFKNPPPGTVSYALVFHDPDSLMEAGYVQYLWLAANIGGDTALLPADASASGEVAMVQGNNYAGEAGYIGPEAREETHTCVFTAYALDTRLALEEGFSLVALEDAMEGHILDKAILEADVDFARIDLGG